jgi:hypothetical protein
MKTYQLGPDEPYDLPDDGFVWLIHSYVSGDYEGHGEAVALQEDGKIRVWYLGHCSCYGPFESGGDLISVESLLAPKESIHDIDVSDEILQLVRQLV